MEHYWALFMFVSLWSFSYAQEYVQVLPRAGSPSLSITASASNGDPSGLVSGASSWNSGKYIEQYVQFDFGRQINLWQISLVVDQSPEGDTVHYLYGGTSGYTDFVIKTFSGYTRAGNVLSTNTNLLTTVRYIRITTTTSKSWVAWARVYVYAAYRCYFYGTPALSLASYTAQICADSNDGTAKVSGSGGSGAYTYYLDTVSQGAVNTYSTLAPGSHSVQLYDSTGCYGGQVSWTTGSATAITVNTISKGQTCSTRNNGWIFVSAAGGYGTLTYSINGTFGNIQNFTNLTPGPYTWYVKDGKSCGKSEAINVDSVPALGASHTITTPIYCNGGQATYTIDATGGVGGYTYSVDGVTYDSKKSFNVTAGDYTYYVKDANSCIVYKSFTITQNPALQVIASTIPSCFEGSNGVVSLVAAGGTGNYTYLVGATSQPTSVFTGLRAGTFSYIVQDSNGCTNSSSTIVQSLEAIQVLDAVVGQQCVGTATGSVILTARGGSNAGFQFSQNGSSFQPSGSFQNLNPGLYEYLIQDDRTCKAHLSVTVPSISEIKVEAIAQPQKCASTASGMINFSVTGGAGAYNYSIDNGASYFTTRQFVGLEPSVYTWRVKDANGCEKTGQVQVNSVTAVSATYSVSNPILCNGGTGSISIFAEGGVGHYSYSLEGDIFVSSNTFNLTAGNYTYYVRDANNCTYTAGAEISQNPVLEISATSLPSCFEKSNGGITISAYGGAGGYKYTVDSVTQLNDTFVSLYGGNYTYKVTDRNGCAASASILVTQFSVIGVEKTVMGQQCAGTATGSVIISASGGSNMGFQFSQNGSNFQSVGIFHNLLPGSYEYLIQDDYTCTSRLNVIVPTISDMAVEVTSRAQLCAFNNSGVISFSVVGGAGNYTYSIDNGLSYFDTVQFNGLAPVTYTWGVKDGNGCKKAGQVVVDFVSAVNGTFNVSTPIQCYNNTGSVTINASGGVGNYSYSLDRVHYSKSNIFSNLHAGNYTYYVIDSNECLFTGYANILQNPPVEVDVKSMPNTKCTGTPSGTITFNASGGIGSFEYQVAGGEFRTSHEATELPSGRYSFRVRDSNKCEVSGNIIVGAGLGVVEATVESTDLKCFNSGDTGSAVIIASNGTLPYQYSINNGTDFQLSPTFDNLSPGSYSIITKDHDLCTYIIYFDIIQPTAVNVTVDATPQTCSGSHTGSVSFHSTGGRGGYQYKFNGTTSVQNTYSELNPGEYSWEVKDTSDCVKSGTVVIEAATAIDITYSLLPTCSERSNGKLTVMVSGGAEGYSFSINNVNYQESPTFTNLASGNFIIYVKDKNGCINSTSIEIPSLPEIAINATIKGQKCSSTATGEVLFGVSGGIGSNYTYSIDGSNFQSNNNFKDLLPGAYDFTIQDSYGCASSFSVKVPAISAIVSNATSNPTCFESYNGRITIVAAGGAEGFSYSLDNTTFQSNSIFTGLPADNYTVYVKDANNCYISYNSVVASLEEIAITTNVVGQQCYNTASGSISLSSTGGNQTGFQYSVDGINFDAKSIFTDLLPGEYKYFVQDNYGCKADTSITVPSISEIQVEASSHSETCHSQHDGAITFTVTGGTGVYTYSVDNGTTFIKENKFNNLESGVYYWLVVDSNKCETMGQTIVLNVTEISATIQVLNPLCFGETGSIVINGSGGTGVYNYSLDDVSYYGSGEFKNLVSGTYSFWVQDSNGCKYSSTVFVAQNPVIQGTAEVSKIACFGGSGLVQINAVGGYGKYEFSFDGSSFINISVFDNVSAGTYEYAIRDENQCTFTDNITVTEPDVLIATASAHGIICSAQNHTGTVLISNIKGGQPPYFYSLDGTLFQSSSLFNNLSSGEYSWYVQDSSDCVISGYITVPIPSDIPNPKINSTSAIPTDGGFLTITGSSFIQPIAFFVDGKQVTTTSESTTEVVAQIEEGTGKHHTVEIEVGELACGYVATSDIFHQLLISLA